MPWYEVVALLAAGMAAGTINTIVGSGTLITFPTLLAFGYAPVVANVSNTIGLVPGSLSGAIGYRRELVGQRGRAIRLGIAATLGGLTGGLLLLALPAAEISIARIVRAVDGPLAPLPCASVAFYRRCDDCDDEKTCEVRRLMREVRDAASAILDNTSLAEAAGLPARKKKAKRPARI